VRYDRKFGWYHTRGLTPFHFAVPMVVA